MSNTVKKVLAGKASTIMRGAYDNNIQYYRLNVVSYNGSSYIAKYDVIGVLPTDTTKWQLFAQKGDSPIKGVDYFTTSEINEIKSDVKDAVKTDLDFDNTIDELNQDISDLENNKIDKNVNDLVHYELKGNTGTNINLTIDSSTYIMTLQLKNSAGIVLNEKTIDLPLETMVVDADYDSNTKEIILTLKNGNTTRFSVANLVSGLQSEITSNNKLPSDLIDPTNQTNQFTTQNEKDNWNAKYDKPNTGIPKTDLADAVQTSLGKADSALQEHQDISGKLDTSKVKNAYSTTSGDIYDATYINAKLGDIDSALDAINGEVI